MVPAVPAVKWGICSTPNWAALRINPSWPALTLILPTSNLQAYHYWSATELAPGTGIADIAFDFDFGYGIQSLGDVSNRVHALAVSPAMSPPSLKPAPGR